MTQPAPIANEHLPGDDFDERPGESACDWLARVLGNIPIDFDSQRTIKGPCFKCGTPANPDHDLYPVTVGSRKTSRPFCEMCAPR